MNAEIVMLISEFSSWIRIITVVFHCTLQFLLSWRNWTVSLFGKKLNLSIYEELYCCFTTFFDYQYISLNYIWNFVWINYLSLQPTVTTDSPSWKVCCFAKYFAILIFKVGKALWMDCDWNNFVFILQNSFILHIN